MSRFIKFLIASIIVMLPPSASFAHGLLMKAEGKDAAITGTLYYSNGQRAGGEWIELFDDAKPDEAVVTIQTNQDGGFRLTAQQGHSYRVKATGEEGHEIAIAITMEDASARGRMVKDADDKDGAKDALPAWAVLGGLLVLSAIPAWFLRKRNEKSGAKNGLHKSKA